MIEKGEELAGECMGSFVSHCLSVCPFYGTVTVNINVHTCLALIFCFFLFLSVILCLYFGPQVSACKSATFVFVTCLHLIHLLFLRL